MIRHITHWHHYLGASYENSFSNDTGASSMRSLEKGLWWTGVRIGRAYRLKEERAAARING